MYDAINSFFVGISKNFMLAFLCFCVVAFLLGKLMDIFLLRFDLKNNYLNDPNRKVAFWVTILGAFLLACGGLLDLYFDYPRIWYIGSVGGVLGGILGLLPFGFKSKQFLLIILAVSFLNCQ